MRVCDLHNKQVINTCDCKILGCVIDIDFDECSGCIKALIVPGPDAVLVEVSLEKITHKCI